MKTPSRAKISTDGEFVADVKGQIVDYTFRANSVDAHFVDGDYLELVGTEDRIDGHPEHLRRFTFFVEKTIENGEYEFDPSKNYHISYLDRGEQVIVHRFEYGTFTINFDLGQGTFEITFNLEAKRVGEDKLVSFIGHLRMKGINTELHQTKTITSSHYQRAADLLPEPKIMEAQGSQLRLEDVKDGATLLIPYSPEMTIGNTLYYRIYGDGAIMGSHAIKDTNNIIIKTSVFPIYVPGQTVQTNYNVGIDSPHSKTAVYDVV